MHPEVEKEEPGICPICGMDLEPKQVAEGMENSSYRDLLHRLYIGIALTVPLLAFSIFAEGEVSRWLQFLFCTPIVLWTGWPFFQRAFESVRHRSLNMFTLIALGVGTAYAYSVWLS